MLHVLIAQGAFYYFDNVYKGAQCWLLLSLLLSMIANHFHQYFFEHQTQAFNLDLHDNSALVNGCNYQVSSKSRISNLGCLLVLSAKHSDSISCFVFKKQLSNIEFSYLSFLIASAKEKVQ